jgi:uncharacterized membrane protein YedE/YeeE
MTPARWSPYWSGALIGMISWLTFLISERGLGASTTFVRLSGVLARLVKPEVAAENEYYQKTGLKPDWQMMLLLGVFLGALLSALGGGSFALRWVPDMWREAFGGSVGPRLLIAFIGGVLVAVGARAAGGCTSGHGITGTLQMSVAGWLSVVAFFVGGIAVAVLIYGSGGGG